MNKRTKNKSVGGSNSGKNTDEVVVPVDIHPLAISQARAFANLSRSISIGIQDSGNHGELLAYLVNAGLSIELYLKALMIAARSGRVTKGHDLDQLYRDFPDFLRDFLEFTYTSRRPAEGWKLTMHALKFSRTQPQVPDMHPSPQFQTFADTLRTTKDAFVHARYFFEKVNTVDWSVFAYAPVPLDAAMLALDAAYEHLLAGSFAARKDMIAERSKDSLLVSPSE
ncbi:MAG: hypothetical protein JWP34_3394 [Massilia sp.]|nr:hypothetical protein [Massilia sp.]